MNKHTLALAIAAAAALLAVISCEVGLGTSVDTTAPKVTITYPPADSTIRSAFVLAGTASDETSLKEVRVSLQNTKDSSKKYTIAESAVIDSVAGTYQITLNTQENGAYPIADGSYEVTVTAVDGAGRTSSTLRSLKIDNTAPLLILTRPSTKAGAATADAYGTDFQVTGQVADDSNVDKLTVDVYENGSDTPKVSVSKNNVPPTIELTVAKWYASDEGLSEEETVNYKNYLDMYGDGSGVTKGFTCTIKAYDEARVFTNSANTVGEGSGNVSSGYYLYNDIYSSVLSKFKATEVYEMLAGIKDKPDDFDEAALTSNIIGTAESTDGNKSGSFSLNPDNSPMWELSGYSPIKAKGAETNNGAVVAALVRTEYEVTNGSKITIKTTAGLDNIILDEASLAITAYPLDEDTPYANGTFKTVGTAVPLLKAEEEVKDDEAALAVRNAAIAASGSYAYLITMTLSNDTFPALTVGTNYLLKVTGTDDNGNAFDNDNNNFYAIHYASKGRAPVIEVTSINGSAPASQNNITVYWTEKDEPRPLVLSGTVTDSDESLNLPVTLIAYKENGERTNPDPQGKPDQQKNASNNAWDFAITDSVFSAHGSQIYTITLASNNGQTTEKNITVYYDVTAPSVELVTPGNGESCGEAALSTNTTTFRGTASDALTSIGGVKYAVVKRGDSAPASDAYKMAKGKNAWTITATLGTGAGTNVYNDGSCTLYEGQYTMYVQAFDTAVSGKEDGGGNMSVPVSCDFDVDKAAPGITTLYKTASMSNTVSTAAQTIAISEAMTLSGTVSDTNGVASVKITRVVKDGNDEIIENGSETEIYTGSAGDTSYSVNAFADLSPIPEGYYTYTYTVLDGVGKTTVKTAVFKYDANPPTLEITSPAANTEWQSTSLVQVNGTASDLSSVASVWYTTNNAAASNENLAAITKENIASNASWKKANGTANWYFSLDMGTSQGANLVTVYAIAFDTAGNKSVSAMSRVINVDITAPVLAVTKVNDVTTTATTSEVSQAALTIKGTAVDIGSGVETVEKTDGNGTLTYSNEHGSWTLIDTLTSGTNTYRLKVTDNAARTSDLTVTVNYDATSPTVTIEAPVASQIGVNSITNTSYTFRGKANDPLVSGYASELSRVEVAIVAQGTLEAAISSTDWKGATGTESWTYSPASLAEGKYTMFVRSVDKAGNVSTTVSRSFDIDVAYPTLSVDALDSVLKILPTIGGTASDTHGIASVEIFRDGALTPVYSTTASPFSYTETSLTDGQHTYGITVTDKVGKTTTVTRTISYDTENPTIAVATPTASSIYSRSSSVTFKGTSADTGSGVDKVEYSTDGTTWTTASGTTSWVASIDFTEGTDYTVQFRAVDNAEHESVLISKTVRVDMTSPVLSTDDGFGSRIVTSLPFTVKGAVSDSLLSTVTYKVGGNGTESTDIHSGSEWDFSVDSIAEGKYTYTVTAKDLAGNTAQQSVTVTYDKTAPSITSPVLTPSGTPQNGWYNSGAVEVSAAVTDATSGLSAVYCKVYQGAVAPTGDTLTAFYNDESTPWKVMAKGNGSAYSRNESLSDGAGYVYIKAVDEAGNDSYAVTNKYQIDSAKPTGTISVDKTLINCTQPLTVSGTAIDSGSGINSVIIKINDENIANGTASLGSGTYSLVIPAATLDGFKNVTTLVIKAIITDVAGSGTADDKTVTVTVDTEKPTVAFTQPTASVVNGTITVSGSTLDTNTVTSLVLTKYVSEDGGVTYGTGTSLLTEGSKYTWSYPYDSSVDDGKTVKFTAVATDAAGNECDAVEKTITVDQDSDRPIITFTTIELDGMTADNPAWIKDKVLRGTVTDDDGLATSGALKIEYSKKSGATWGEFSELTNTGSASDWSATIPGATPDGTYQLRFTIKDGKNTLFTSAVETNPNAAALQVTPKIQDVDKDADGQYGYKNTSQKATYVYLTLDTGAPTLNELTYKYSSDGITWQEPDAKDSSIVGKEFGGTVKRYLKVKVHAEDTNGMKDVYGTLSRQADSIDVAFTDNDSDGYYESSVIDTAGKDGYYTLKVTAEDNAAMVSEETYQFLIDTTAPAVTVTSHNDGDAVIGGTSVALKGITDNATSIQYAVSTTDVVPDSGWQTLEGSELAWKLVFDDGVIADETHCGFLNTFLYNAATVSDKTNIWHGDPSGDSYDSEDSLLVYIHLKASDVFGNEVTTTHSLTVDPSGNRPTASITYPADNSILGSSIRMYGSATDNSGVTGVYVQYGVFDGSTVVYKTASGAVSGYEQIPGTTEYGLKANGKVTWNMTVNAADAGALGSDNKLYIRVYSVDNTTPTSVLSVPCDIEVTIDTAAPQIGVYKQLTLEQYDASGNVIASRKYEDDMWIKGTWYLTGSICDENGIAQVTKDGAELSSGNLIDDNCGYALSGFAKNYMIKIAVGSDSGCGNESFILEAVDNDDGSPRSTVRSISINYDNTAPVLSEDISEGYTISGTVINDNGFFRLAGVVNEDNMSNKAQSGFKYLAISFVRRNSADREGTVFNPMVAKSIATNKTATTSLTYQDGLWWKGIETTINDDSADVTVSDTTGIYPGTLVKIDNALYQVSAISGTTITLSANPVAGTKTVYFAKALTVDNQSQESAKNGVVTGTNGYYASSDISNDDGDGIVEYVNRSSTTYSWMAYVNSKNIPDGDIEIHYTAYDAAGNYACGMVGYENTKTTYLGKITDAESADFTTSLSLYNDRDAFVSNNQPRLAGVMFGTDSNANGVVDADEYIEGWSALMTAYDYNAAGAKQNTVLAGDASDTEKLKKVGYDSTMNKVTEITAGTASSAILTAKGVTKIIPTVIGGTDELDYTCAITKNGVDTPYVTTALKSLASPLAGEGDDVTRNTIELMTELLGDTHTTDASGTKPSKFEFNIWTKTGGKTIGTDSQLAKVTAYMNVSLGDNVVPTATITPFYWNSASDNSLYGNSPANGHIELETDLPVAFTAGGTGVNDRDPKVSGKITYRGTIIDNIVIDNISMRLATGSSDVFTFGGITAKNSTHYKIASYDSVLGTWTKGDGSNTVITPDGEDTYKVGDFDADGWLLSFTSAFTENGHEIVWELDLDTAKVTGVASTDVALTVLTSDKGKIENATESGGVWTYDYGSENASVPGTTQTTAADLTGYYRADVVPYITGVKTRLSTLKSNNPSVYNRTVRGHYIVASNEGNITLSGFNLAGGATTATVASSSLSSGAYTYTTGTVGTLNNSNNNDAKGGYVMPADATIGVTGNYAVYTNYYNRQPNNDNNNNLTDNVEFDVWEINSQAARPVSGKLTEPIMRINPVNDIIGFAFRNGAANFSMSSGVDSNQDSYTIWQNNYAAFNNVSFVFDANGHAHGTCTGLDTYPDGNKDLAGRFTYVTSKWGVCRINDMNDNYYHDNKLRLEHIGVKNCYVKGTYTNTCVMDEERFHSPSIATTVHGTNTSVYLAYYDDIQNQIRFRYGETTPNGRGNFSQFVDPNGTEDAGNNDATKTAKDATNTRYSLIAGLESDLNPDTNTPVNKAGEYVAIDAIAGANIDSDVVVAVWYDGTDLKYSYKKSPNTDYNASNTHGDGYWSEAQTIFSGAGEYCTVKADTLGGIHIAAYDIAGANLLYAYLDSYNGSYSEATDKCVVDSYAITGTNITIDTVCKTINGVKTAVPYISYYNASTVRPKLAYLVTPETGALNYSLAGADSSDRFTGSWEVITIPTSSKMRQDRVNVGIWKDSDGYFKAANSIARGTASATTQNGKQYSNSTNNPILGYAVTVGTNGSIETAQMK